MSEAKKNEVVPVKKKDIIDNVSRSIRDYQANGQINFPENYSPENALKSAWLLLQDLTDKQGKPALARCTQASIANAFLDIAVQGLSPAKKQVYLIVYGDKLQAFRSYFGTIAAVKRLKGVTDVFAQVVYEGDEFEYSIKDGVKKILSHSQKITNINNDKIVGAYATIVKDGETYSEIMTFPQIKTSWSRTKMTNNIVQKDFPEEMAKRTVINRLCKWFANVSDDSDVIIQSFNRTTENEYIEGDDSAAEESANTILIDIEDEVEEEVPDSKVEGKDIPLPWDQADE